GALLVYGLFPPQAQAGIDFASWFMWSIPLTVILFVGGIVAILTIYRAKAAGPVSPETIHSQLALLGSMTRQERLMIVIAAIALVVFIWQPFGLDPPWIMLLAVGVMVIGGVIDRTALRGSIDWPMLIQMASMMGLG